MPAARVGDMLTCMGPPGAIIPPGCPTVLIGDGAAGGGGGGGGGGPSGGGGGAGSARAALMADPESITKEPHWVEIEFVDAAGLPVSGIFYRFADPNGAESEGLLRLDGTVRRDALSSGTCTVELKYLSGAQWARPTARVGEAVTMRATVEGFEDGALARFQVFKRDIARPDVVVADIMAKVQGNAVEADWTFAYPENLQTSGGFQDVLYSSPVFFFEVLVGPCEARSGMLEVLDTIEFTLLDPYDQPVAQADYVLYLSSGEVRKGKLDARGKKREEQVPVTPWSIEFPGQQEITVQKSDANLTKL